MRCALLLGAAMLSGCSVYQADSGDGLAGSSLIAAGAGQGIAVQVDGSVGGARGAALAAAVADAMPRKIGDAPIRYAPCEAYTECAGDHIVWTFGPPAARPASAYPPALATNIDWIGPYQPAPDAVTVKVALIQNGDVVASASGQVEADKPDAPAFRDLIASMSAVVLPSPGWFD
jgi:hypothetical protein